MYFLFCALYGVCVCKIVLIFFFVLISMVFFVCTILWYVFFLLVYFASIICYLTKPIIKTLHLHILKNVFMLEYNYRLIYHYCIV